MSSVSTIQAFHIGVPAATSREVIDTSYSISWLLLFKNKEDQDSYQTDPVHLNFVETCKYLSAMFFMGSNNCTEFEIFNRFI